MFARFLLTAYVLGCSACLQPALAMDMREEAGVRLEWRSEKQDPTELARDLERFYVVLYNTGNLPVREIRDPKQSAMRVEEILRSERLFFGGFFPVGVDAVMCDLNPQICDRERVQVSAKELPLVAEHVGGYRKTSGRWKNDSSAVVLVPLVVFDQYATIAERPLSPKEDIEALSQVPGIDCSERWKLSCADLVQRLNPAIFDSKRTQGSRPREIKLPTQGLRAEIVLAGVRDQRDLSPTFTGVGQETTEVRDDRLDRFAASWRDALKSLAPAALTVEALHDNIPSFGPAKAEGIIDAHFAEQRSLLELINHPFINGGEDRDELKQPVPIAVFDFLFDRNHCELMDSVVVDALAPPGSNGGPATAEPDDVDRPRPQHCGDRMSRPPTTVFDHGTHVAGIIGSKPNADGVVGLNPFAKLHYVGLDQPKLIDSRYRDRIAGKMIELGIIATEPVKVVNLSWTYVNQGGNDDAIGKRIEALDQNTLFVVAAGNGNEERTGDACAEFPACFRDHANVIAVIGLDRTPNSPKLWRKSDEEGSNWGADFGVGAIASDVLSTTYRGGIGVMSGTSQAAPQVAAAASLMYSVFETRFRVAQPELLPIRVKNRLIYTSDMFNDLLDRVMGGRLNVERAIDFAHDWIAISKDGDVQKYQGKLVKFGNFEVGQEYVECALPGGGAQQIKLVDLRRMFYDEFREKYVIFFNSVSGNDDSELSRLVSCELTTRTHEGVFETKPNNVDITFQFKDIRDYISSMY